MRILALDTSTAACSCALWHQGGVVASRFEAMSRGQSEVLMPMIDGMLKDADCPTSSIERIAVTTGPGAFTGVRIGLSAARGLALALSCPLIGISTFDTLAHGTREQPSSKNWTMAVIDSKRGDVFIQLYDGDLSLVGEGRALTEASALAVLQDELPSGGECTLVGDAAERLFESCDNAALAERLHALAANPNAETLARLASERGSSASGNDALKPIYLRAPDVNIQPGGGRLRP